MYMYTCLLGIASNTATNEDYMKEVFTDYSRKSLTIWGCSGSQINGVAFLQYTGMHMPSDITLVAGAGFPQRNVHQCFTNEAVSSVAKYLLLLVETYGIHFVSTDTEPDVSIKA
jgi:hypothetical protein